MAGCGCELEIESEEQRRILITLLAINATMFLVELSLGVMAESMGLIADSLDMLADATVYGIGLYAVGRAVTDKIRAARLSGIFQIALALGIAFEIIRRVFWGSDPEPIYMVGVSLIALIANVICLSLIAKHRDGDIHMRASWIFSKNDVIANVGVVIGGLLVYIFSTRWPDLVIGSIIVGVILRGGLAIIADARRESLRN
jgi:Co/Zn/Cd efflux system component